MATSVSIFRIRFPEFSDEDDFSDERIQLFLDDAKDCYMGEDEDRWGGRYDKAQAYLAAHLLTAGTATEAGDASSRAGPVSSKSAGGVSVTRATQTKERSDGDDFFMNTSYGQQYISLRNLSFVGVLAVAGNA